MINTLLSFYAKSFFQKNCQIFSYIFLKIHFRKPSLSSPSPPNSQTKPKRQNHLNTNENNITHLVKQHQYNKKNY